MPWVGMVKELALVAEETSSWAYRRDLENQPADSHVASTDEDEFGRIFRRSIRYGTVTTPAKLDESSVKLT